MSEPARRDDMIITAAFVLFAWAVLVSSGGTPPARALAQPAPPEAAPPAPEPPRRKFAPRDGLVPRTVLSLREFERPGFVMAEARLHPTSPDPHVASCYRCGQQFYTNQHNTTLVVFTREPQYTHSAHACPYPECNGAGGQRTLYRDEDVLLRLLRDNCSIVVPAPRAPKGIRRLFDPPGCPLTATDASDAQIKVCDHAHWAQPQHFGPVS